MLAVPVVYFIACNKSSSPGYTSCTSTAVDDDSAQLLKFADDSIKPLTRDTTGVYYQIIDTGTGATPVPTSTLTVSYTARLMDRTIFDTANNVTLSYPLYQLIPGWQVGLQKIKEGGHIKLLIPSALAYGCQGAGSSNSVVIPPNAPVYFDIYLIRIGS